MAAVLRSAACGAGRSAAAFAPLASRRRAPLACAPFAASPARRPSSSSSLPPHSLPPPSWSLAELHRTAKADADGVDVTDATVLHVAKLSHLALARGSPEFERVKRSLASVLASTRAVQRIIAAKQLQHQRDGGALGGGGDAPFPASAGPTAAAAAGASLPEDALEGLSDAQFEALAAARYADLRRDAVVAGPAAGGEQLLNHAPRTEGGYFSVPKVVGGE